MITSVSNQAYVFLCTIIGGMAIALVYDFFRILRKAVRTSGTVTYVQDLLYWLIAAAIMFITVYYSNDGQLRAYLFAGAITGAILYALLFSNMVMRSSLFIIKIVSKAVKAAVFIATYPAKLIGFLRKGQNGK